MNLSIQRYRRIVSRAALFLGLSVVPHLATAARPDFNGDGRADLAAGAPGESLGAYLRTGQVHVIYGGAGGLAPFGTQVFDASQCRLSQDGAITGNQSALGFGSVLAWGDFNGDGVDDLAMGMPNYNPPYPVGGMPEAGMVYVLFGSRAGTAYPNGFVSPGGLVLNFTQHFVSTNVGGNPQFGSNGAVPSLNVNQNTGDRFGHALAAGDFNGDGISDLAIGTPGEEGWDGVSQIEDAGDVYVLYGRRAGLSSASRGGFDGRGGGLDASTAQGWSQNGKNFYWLDIQDHPQSSDRFGSSLVAGDFNGDGRFDLAIGAPGEAGGTGGVNVIYGSPGGLQPNAATPNGVIVNQFWHQDVANVEGVRAPGEGFGTSLAAGDFNGDGRFDLAIGVPRAAVAGAQWAGEVNVIYGSPQGLHLAFAGLPLDQIWSQNSPGIADDGILGGEMFGLALAAGDFDGDGRADLAVGAPYDSPDQVTSAGAVNVIYGSVGGLNWAGNQYWHQNTIANPGDQNGPHEQFGRYLVVGNFNPANGADRVDDLAIGVPGENVGPALAAGQANVLYGALNIGLIAAGNQIWNQNNLGVAGVAAGLDEAFGVK